MSSPSPEPLSPPISPARPQPFPPSSSPPPSPLIIAPSPSPLPPSPPTPTSITPLLPPAMSPAADNPQPPAIWPPPPATPLPPPPPPPLSPPPDASASPPLPVRPAPLPPPVLTSPPPTPKLVPRSPPPNRKTPLKPELPSSPPQERSPSPANPPSPATVRPNPLPPATVKPQPPPQETSSTSPPLPSTAPSESPVPVDSAPSPEANSVFKSPTRLASPPAPPLTLPSSSSSSKGSFPAAVEIQKPRPNTSPGFIVGFIGAGLVVLAVLVIVLACICYRSSRRRKGQAHGLPVNHHKVTSLGPKGSSFLTQLPNPSLQSAPTKSTALNSTPINSEHELPETHQSISPPPPTLTNGMVFTYDRLAEATGEFSDSNLIGEGGFGFVYKGILPGGKEVAVKRLKMGRGQGEREFQAEVDIISRVHHKHLVSLLGYCIRGIERLLVYEFVPNNTLEFHLHGKEQHVMEWTTRLKIAIGSAKGLAYLHEDCNPKIIHRDIKASNILLDFRFDAKVSDFGLAKSFSDTNTHVTHISTRVIGTFGYLAPEYASSGKLTEKSDVYSYGVMLLELITGLPPINSTDPMRNQGLVEWARPLLAQALEQGYFETLVDSRIQSKYDTVEMTRMVSCAAACVRHSAWLRPRMSQIVHALEGHSSLRDLHEGTTPGSSSLYSSSSCKYSVHQHKSDLNQFHLTIADDQDDSTKNWYSGSTSEYGLNPSVSSGEAHQTL